MRQSSCRSRDASPRYHCDEGNDTSGVMLGLPLSRRTVPFAMAADIGRRPASPGPKPDIENGSGSGSDSDSDSGSNSDCGSGCP